MALFPLTFAKLLFLLPIVGIPVFYFLTRKRSLGLLFSLLFVPPLLAEAAMITAFSDSHLTTRVFLEVLAAYYPFAIVGLGLWSPFVGLVGAYLVERIAQDQWLVRRPILYVAGLAFGAIVGGGLLSAYVAIANTLQPDSPSASAPWIVGGIVGGATGGLIVALFYRNCFSSKLIEGASVG